MVVVVLIRDLIKSLRRGNLGVLSIATVLVVALGTFGSYLAERPVNVQFKNVGDGLWWTLVTMSTVGYGDKVPVTLLGRTIGTICMVSGPLLMVSFIGSVGVRLYDTWTKGVKGMAQVKSKRHILLCGWNWKAEDIINELRLSELREAHITIIDDNLETKPTDDPRTSFVKGNASETRVLARANVSEASFAVVLADNGTIAADQKTVLTVLSIKKSNTSIVVCAELNDANNEEHLRQAGCEIVVNASLLSSRLLAMSLQNPVVVPIVTELVSQVGNEVYQVKIPGEYVGRPFLEALSSFKSSHAGILIGIERDGTATMNPPASEVLRESDILLILAEESPSV